METENPTIDCQGQTNNITGKILQNLVYENLLLLEVRDQKLRPYHKLLLHFSTFVLHVSAQIKMVFFFQASGNFEGNKTEVCQIEEEKGIQSETSKQDLMHFNDNETLEQCKKFFLTIIFLKKTFGKK